MSLKIRDTYKYYLKVNDEIVWKDVTSNLERREKEHQIRYGSEAHIFQIGYRVTREKGVRWLRYEKGNQESY